MFMCFSFFREKQRGGGNSVEGKTYHKTPSQKRFWTPPTYDTFPPPSFVFALLFSLKETGTDQANPTFSGLQNWFWRRTLWYVFPPPQIARYVLPPHQLLSNLPEKASFEAIFNLKGYFIF